MSSSLVTSNEWQQLLVDSTKAAASRFTNMIHLPPVSMAPASGSRGGIIMEGARIRELIAGRSGAGAGGAGGGGGQKMSSSGAWSPMDSSGITVDPSKGGLALQGVGLATSHCLAQFTSDPAFAERAAKFSSFSNGKYSASQIAQPLPVGDGGCKPRARSADSGGGGKLSRTSSSCQNAGAAKKFVDVRAAGALASELEVKAAAAAASSAAVAAAVEVVEVVDMDAEALGDDKSLPRSGAAEQPELEAVEGATEATMDVDDHHPHDLVEVVAVAAAQETSSCSEQQQQHGGGGGQGGEGGCSPARSPADRTSSAAPLKRKLLLRSSSSPAAALKEHAASCRLQDSFKVGEVEDSKPKRCKGGEDGGRGRERGECGASKAERSCSENSGEESGGSPRAHKENHKPKEHLLQGSKQDYIHVRARRGQATDSHSLAERVRREKISERMKYLQDLVPGCSKVTGKAVMLDEIINYVQSLQHQVEHLSMKLASVNPGRMDFNLESVLSSKEMLQSRLSSVLGGPETNATFGLQLQQQQQQLQQQQQQGQGPMLGGLCGLDFRSMGPAMDSYLRRSYSAPITGPSGLTTVDTFDDNVSQSIGWDGELQSIVQMGFGHQARHGSLLLEGLHCQLPVDHMKVEL